MLRHIHPDMSTNVNRFERLVEIERIITGLRAEQRQLLEGALQSERDEPVGERTMQTVAKPQTAVTAPRKARTPGVTTMILTRLQELPPATSTDIAKALGLEPISVSTTLNRLKKEGRAVSSGGRRNMLWSAAKVNGNAAVID
jgi:CRP-like cAMP-binding protein